MWLLKRHYPDFVPKNSHRQTCQAIELTTGIRLYDMITHNGINTNKPLRVDEPNEKESKK